MDSNLRSLTGNVGGSEPLAADNFDTCLAFTLKAEGGYSDNPADPGGPTNMGITLATYRQWSDDPNLAALQVQDILSS